MKDEELLKMAARAMGYEFKTTDLPEGHHGLWLIGKRFHTNWNPLANDADAFELAFKLKMELITNKKNKLNETQRQCRARIMIDDGIRNFYEILNENSQDGSPLRRAIVRAAAEIGKAIPRD